MRYLMLFVLLMFTTLVQARPDAKPYNENANARQDIQAALNQAHTNGKLVLLEFGANW